MRRLTGLALAVAVAVTTLAAGSAADAGTRAETSPWRVVFRASTPYLVLTSITAVNRQDAWAVGFYGKTGDARRPVVLHWNGSRWARVTVAVMGTGYTASRVQSTGPDDVWIIGTATVKDRTQTRDLRFNGTGWSVVPTPSTLLGAGIVVSYSNAWMIATESCRTLPARCSTRLAHWNGSAWTYFWVPFEVSGFAAVDGHVWVTGLERMDVARGIGYPALFKWNGRQWTGFGRTYQHLAYPSSVAASRRGDVWLQITPAAGKNRELIYHWRHGHRTSMAIPKTVGGLGLVVSTPITYDGRRGFWSALARWTGTRWINLNFYATKGLSQGLDDNFTVPVAPVPGTASAWAIGFAWPAPGTGQSPDSIIAINGPVP